MDKPQDCNKVQGFCKLNLSMLAPGDKQKAEVLDQQAQMLAEAKAEAAEQLAKTNEAMADRHEQLCSSLSELHMYKTAHALLLHKPYASSMQRGLAAAGGSEGACKFRQDILRLACSSGKGSGGAADPYTPSPGQTTGLQSLGKC